MARKIVKLKTSLVGNFPTLEEKYPPGKLLTEEITINGEVFIVGQNDPRYRQPEFYRCIMNADDIEFWSFHEEYTDEHFSQIDPDFEVMDNLDGNFTYTCLKYGYIRDLNTLIEYGCPEYDSNVHNQFVFVEQLPLNGTVWMPEEQEETNNTEPDGV